MHTQTSEIAPTGKLRCASIAVSAVGGVGEPIAKFIADRLSVPLDFVRHPDPEAYEQNFRQDEWDIAIGPRILAPADMAHLTRDVWLIDLLYLAAEGQAFASPNEVDRPGIKVGTIQNSPADRFLSRTLKSAALVRLPLSPNFSADAIDMLRSGNAHLFGVDAGLIALIASSYPGAKILTGAFDTVRVAVALPKDRSSAAEAELNKIVREVKRNGIVQKAIEHAGLTNGVRVAPVGS
jgi:polar amino acid transport system substrate-binding protein